MSKTENARERGEKRMVGGKRGNVGKCGAIAWNRKILRHCHVASRRTRSATASCWKQPNFLWIMNSIKTEILLQPHDTEDCGVTPSKCHMKPRTMPGLPHCIKKKLRDTEPKSGDLFIQGTQMCRWRKMSSQERSVGGHHNHVVWAGVHVIPVIDG